MELKFIIVLFSMLSLSQCGKGNQTIYTESCFEIKDGYVFLNIYNKSDDDIYLPKITSILDNDLYLLKSYYEIKDDTLFIEFTNEKHINISHRSPSTKIRVRSDSIKIEKGKQAQQIFRLEENFNHIIVDSHNLEIPQC